MTLKQWLKDTGTRQADLADAIGVAQSYIAQISANGTASLSVALAIHKFTKGKVSMRSLEKVGS